MIRIHTDDGWYYDTNSLEYAAAVLLLGDDTATFDIAVRNANRTPFPDRKAFRASSVTSIEPN